MNIEFFIQGTLNNRQENDIDKLNQSLTNPTDPDVDMYDWADPAYGEIIASDGDKVIGKVSIYKTEAEYHGQPYCLGGFGGLVVASEYRGYGYGRKLAEEALKKLEDISVDVACMCVNMESGITEFYKRLGYCFLNRPAYFTNWINKEKSDATVMILGICDEELAETILTTNYRFDYGKNKGHW